jgi:ABC-type multidrug transport system fused ATPase/permease subunit
MDEKLWNVLAAVGLHDTFRTLGKGLDSDVGIAGNSLSSGQQQLLSLARALLRNCPILVLDEATSHVDATTEQTFKTVLRGPQLSEAKSTVISVAHRPESLTVADRIIHVVDGQIRQVAQSSQVASI